MIFLVYNVKPICAYLCVYGGFPWRRCAFSFSQSGTPISGRRDILKGVSLPTFACKTMTVFERGESDQAGKRHQLGAVEDSLQTRDTKAKFGCVTERMWSVI